MKQLNRVSQTVLTLIGAAALCIGCGTTQNARDKTFFTSGNREADQRADQRMAQSQQLHGSNGGSANPANANSQKSLYDRLGGDEGVKKIVDDFTTRMLADPRVNFSRKGVTRGGFSIHHGASEEWQATPDKVAELKKHIVQFIALSTGGPSQYDGRPMKDSHANMHITNAEFDAAVGDLKASLDKVQVPTPEQKELLAVIESTRQQIVEER